jgi:3-oxoacyl-[acyl-carrier protein] reductase
MALRFAAEGAAVFVGYRHRREEAVECVERCKERGAEATPVELDLEDSVAIRAAVSALPALDVLVNNAATVRDQFFLMQSDAEDAEVISINLGGTMACIRAALPGMLRQGRGAIVNVASVAALHGSPGQASYAASKGGMISLTKTLAVELAGRGVRVNAIAPGVFDAGMAARMDHRARTKKLERIPMGRAGSAEELAAVVAFLASDEASYMTGQAVVVDGGMSA